MRQFIALIVLALSLAASSAKARQAGAALVDISPEKLPAIRNGGFLQAIWDRVADPLYARALVFDDGENRIAIVIVDSCMVPRDICDQAKRIAGEKTGIAEEHILIASTHTHSAPSVMANCLGSGMAEDYAARLPGLIARSIETATANLQPARLGAAVIDAPDHTHCRRWITRPDKMLTDPFGEKTVRAMMHPGYQNPNYIGPAGAVDSGLSVLSIQAEDGTPIAVLANYSMHYLGKNGAGFSADYFGEFARGLEATVGKNHEGFVGMMSQGTSGDLHWMDYSRPRANITHEQYSAELVELARRAMEEIEYRNDWDLAMEERRLTLRHRTPNPDRLQWARETFPEMGTRPPRDRPEVYARQAVLLHENPQQEIKLQALRIGDIGITALPNEVYAITGLKLKAWSPLATTFNIELANGASGYIPPPEQHELGGYTTWPASTAGLEVQAEPRIVETTLALLERVADAPRRAGGENAGDYPQRLLEFDPSAYWRMGQLTWTPLKNEVDAAQTATATPGVALGLPGPAGAAFSGNDVNRSVHFAGGYATTELALEKPDFSLSAWFWNGLEPHVRDVTGTLFTFGGDQLQIGGLAGDDETGRLVFADAEGTRQAGTRILALREWHHVTLVREAGEVRVFLDGRDQPEIVVQSPAPAIARKKVPLWIGSDEEVEHSFEGRIDELAVFPRALSGEEIASLYDLSGYQAPVATIPPKPRRRSFAEADLRRYADAVKASKPLAYWPLRAESKDLDFEKGAAPLAPDTEAANFTGGRVHADVGKLGNRYSLEAWICNHRPHGTKPVTGYLLSRGPDGKQGTPGESLGIGGTYGDPGRLLVYNGDARRESLNGRTTLVRNGWHHVVLVRDGRRIRVHLDGNPAPDIEGVLEVQYPAQSGSLFIGGRNDRFGAFEGRIDEIAVYDRALTPEEIAAHFAAANSSIGTRE